MNFDSDELWQEVFAPLEYQSGMVNFRFTDRKGHEYKLRYSFHDNSFYITGVFFDSKKREIRGMNYLPKSLRKTLMRKAYQKMLEEMKKMSKLRERS